jgi:hypothetical protein
MADCLSEPWKSHYTSLKAQYDTALEQLPATDQVPEALKANTVLQAFYSCLSGANALCSLMASKLNSSATETATALNSAVDARILDLLAKGELVKKDGIDKLIAHGIAAKTTAGELVAKATVTQLCSEARTAGLTEGESKVRVEVQAQAERTTRIGARKTALQTAGLPMPDAALEALLGGTEEEFTTIKTTAQNRIDALRKRGVALNAKSSLLGKVFLPEAQWKPLEDLVVETLSSGADPLITSANPVAGGAPHGPICV